VDYSPRWTIVGLLRFLLEFWAFFSRSIDGSGSGAPRKVKIRGFPAGRASFGERFVVFNKIFLDNYTVLVFVKAHAG
jgi:hypothetical protein